ESCAPAWYRALFAKETLRNRKAFRPCPSRCPRPHSGCVRRRLAARVSARERNAAGRAAGAAGIQRTKVRTMARVALVTGGTRGIGEAISVGLKKAGYKVAASYAGNEERARSFTSRTGINAYKWDVADF